MATCAKCGATANEEAAFCGICGAPLGAAAPAHVTTKGAADATVDPPQVAPPPDDKGAPIKPVRAQRTLPEAPISAAMKPVQVVPGRMAGEPTLDKGFKAPKHLPAGALVDKKYAVLRVLGEGGMGVVYLARDIHTGLDVVVKAVRSELAHRDDVRARTLAEGRALAQIDHPNVVHLRAVAVEGPNLFLVMQYIEGDSLDRMIATYNQRGERMPVEEALGIFRQITAGVGAAHEEGVIHRDLKPANVLIRKKDRVVKVTDFGIALVQGDTTRPHTRGILGSLWYMSPEQVTGRRDLDHRVDVYALGILLYQMLVGRVPFDAKSDYDIMKQHAESPMPFAAAARPDLPAAVDELIQRACAKDRGQRFQGCQELIAAVDRVLQGGVAPAVRAGSVTPPPPVQTPQPAPVGPPTGATPLAVNPPTDEGSPSGVPPTEPPGVLAAATGPSTSEEIAAVVRPRRRGKALWIVLALVVIGGGAGAAFAVGLVPGVPGIWKLPRGFRIGLGLGGPDAGASAKPSASAKPGASAKPDGGAPGRGFEALAGGWVSNGRELDAVVSGSDLEFRVKKPEQFAPQGYEAGEARFVLRATGDPAVFAVEDRIRPLPPAGKTYDPRARGTCQEVWTAVGSDSLKARYDGVRLSVEFAKIEPTAGNFTAEGAKVTSCVGLHDLKASKVVSVLTRP
jgi:serine/threonine-protein kinase